MAKQLGAAVVGTGFIGPVHAEALRRLGRPVVGILGSSAAKSKAAAEALVIPRGYASYDELLADPEVAVVHITSPNRYHFEQARRAIEAGKHVVCEKPLAMTTKETADLVRLSQAASVVTAVCYNIRFYPMCREAQARFAAGQAGNVFHITGSYVQDWLFLDTDFSWRILAEEGGALRAVADIGTHWLDLVAWITGQTVIEVCADLRTFYPTRRRPKGSVEAFQNKLGVARETEPINVTTEDYGSILLRFAGGGSGCCTVSQVAAGRKNCLRWEIAGSKAAYAWNSEVPNELWIGKRDQPNECFIRDPALLQPQVQPFTNYPGGHNEGFPDTFKQIFRAVYGYIEKGDYQTPRPFPTFEDGHKEVAICEAVLQSHQENRWVNVKDDIMS